MIGGFQDGAGACAALSSPVHARRPSLDLPPPPHAPVSPAAARKGSASLLRSLVDAGGKDSLLTADCDGKTAAEIARRNGNAAMHVLMKEQQLLQRERQRSTTASRESPRPNEHRQQRSAWVGRRLQQRKAPAGGGN